MVMLDVKGRPGRDSQESRAGNGTGGAPLRESVEMGERLDTAPEPRHKKATHWLHSVPSASVRYYVFAEPTPESESTGGDHANVVWEAGGGALQAQTPSDTLAAPEQI